MRERPRRVGLFLRGGSYAYQDEVLVGAHQECRARGADLTALAGGKVTDADPRNFVYALPGAGDLDAAIFVQGTMGAPEGDPAMRALFDRLRPLPMCTIGAREQGIACISIDNVTGVRALTRHLIEVHDRRGIAFVTGHGREADERLAGYRAGHRDRGLVPDEKLIIPGDFLFAAGQEAVAKLFDGAGTGCDALLAANDWMALGALEALAARGLRVPEDVAVVGFDDIDEARFAMPPLTTVRQAPRQLGIEAVRLVLALVAGENAPREVVLETFPRFRQSCGCFRGARRAPSDLTAGVRPPIGDPSAWAEATAASGPAPDPSIPSDWAQRMAGSLRRDLDARKGESFLAAVDDIVSKAAELGNISAWHQPVAALRREVARDLGSVTTQLLQAEALFERAHILIGDHAERIQGRRRLETEAAFRAMSELGTDVLTALDLPSIGRALAARLPRLQVSSAAVVVASGGAPVSADLCRLIIAWDRATGLVPLGEGTPFRAGELVPESLRPERRHTRMVQPLCFKDEALGWCVFEMDPPRAAVCQEIPEQISAALKATMLQAQLVAEVTKRERAERARLEHEMELAASIQTGILPKEPRVSRLELATAMVPASEVGGDYFDVLPFEGGCWLGIGDVVGHGLHAGLMMMMIQSVVSAATHDQPLASPAQIWRVLNAVVHENVHARLGRDEHATLTLIRYEDTGRLVHAGAHGDLLVYRASLRRCERIETKGIWAGMMPDPPPALTQDLDCQLEPGDTVLLHTDGITEARNGAREMFGTERLVSAFEGAAHLSVGEIRDRVLAEVRAFMAEQVDDLTLVVLRYG
jgi:serine phosphatase RsbU (regulator of sigma subunit)/DNA-binding LacI/PurR family transcriptional regulator